ncbi:methyltransferase domain-containing protein [Bradyrhizobium sp. 4]|uniref:class I SAM-dependent methyltransferase n=1 Tax=unclassified Bradyrhizobium TaxID=2631580 RepID=UPI001FFB9409|nr:MULTISPECIES: methyltransferase domain-containing protein [unclassified Bradyrhizobium]MCK1397437.1 methyltransferase domain-containing protein [Bradyrhizobium sp. 39]MCK1752524.1 methyltransferase domain-containing protein [Bradyrhizobium sp. 135]UPJ36743.1 methyltransferase domain-containing protein [Bradyrhizobium sp. 4]
MTATNDSTSAIQVDAEFYGFSEYVHLRRWISYWYQIDAVLRHKPRSVLEIGPGNGTTTSALRKAGIEVKTFDFDPRLEPDYVGDIRRLTQAVPQKTHDLVCAFQVLEHLPFEDFEPTIAELANAARDHVVISVPHWGYPVEIRGRLFKDRLKFAFARKLTRPKSWTFDGQHYWELGTRGHSVNKVAEIISRHMQIERQWFCPDYSYHYFFECSVRAP